MDVHSLPVRSASVHIVVAVGPKGYGFWREWTARRFLAEVSRVLVPAGELIVIGRFVNPWFNAELGSREGRRYVRSVAAEVGLRVADFLTPLGRHPIALVFRMRGNRFIQRTSAGKKLGVPCYFHRFVRLIDPAKGERRAAPR